MTDRVPLYFDTFEIGNVIVDDDGQMTFVYTPRWLGTAGAFPLSTQIPLRTGPHPSRLIEPWLANLLPEERQLTIVAHALGLDRTNSLAILREIGADTAGALSFGMPSDRGSWRYTPLRDLYDEANEDAALDRHFIDLGRRPLLVGEDGVRQSLAGGQKKSVLTVLEPDGRPVLRLPRDGDVISVPLDGAPSTLVVKPDNPDLPGIVENELFCLRLARAVGIEAVEATALTGSTRSAIAILRYDRRIGRDGQLQRLHQEGFAQANALPPGLKYEIGTRAGLDLAGLFATRRHLSSVDALALLDQVIFNLLVANTDAHAKNYSILLPIGQAPRLAPLYDVSSVLPWDGVVNQTHAQKIAGKKRRPGDIAARHWDAISSSAGFRPAGVRRRVADLIDQMVACRVAVVEEVSALPGILPGYVEEVAGLVERNALRIAGRLK